MKRLWVACMVLTLGIGLGAIGCREEGPMEKAGEKIDEQVEGAGDAVDDAVDDAEDALDDD